ncbi:MAG: S8 family serine peptidase [Euryarchaeota archaeon]|nr:S8 family serine peptidase [Euryarchaeota archaeon]
MKPGAVFLTLILVIPTAIVTATDGSPTQGRLDPLVSSWAEERAGESVSILVRFSSPPGPAQFKALYERGFTPLVTYKILPTVLVTGPAVLAPSLASISGVEFVEADRTIPYLLDTATEAVGARPLWTSSHTRWAANGSSTPVAMGIDGSGIGIAIVDSGIDATHPDLLLKDLGEATGKPWTTKANYKVVGRDSVELVANSPLDGPVQANMLAIPMAHTDNTGGHGTHVAGAAAGKAVASEGKYKGSAPGSFLVGYGAGEALVVGLALAAFDHIYQHHEELGIRIVSNSWGGAGDWQPDFSVTKAAQKLVNEEGLVVLFAAGNSGGDGNTISTSTWANIPEVISVANWNEALTYVDGSSSRGQKNLERTWPDFAAVGTNLISTAALAGPVTYYGNAQDALLLGSEMVVPVPTPFTVEEEGIIVGPYASFTGTSMATPLAAGVVAQLLQANQDLSPAEVKELLRETASMPSGKTYAADGFALGRGLIDASRATAAALRHGDGLSIRNAVLSSTATGSPLVLNAEEPDAGPISVEPAIPASIVAGVPTLYTAEATGG